MYSIKVFFPVFCTFTIFSLILQASGQRKKFTNINPRIGEYPKFRDTIFRKILRTKFLEISRNTFTEIHSHHKKKKRLRWITYIYAFTQGNKAKDTYNYLIFTIVLILAIIISLYNKRTQIEKQRKKAIRKWNKKFLERVS
jgi:hypothetical protein